MSEMGGKRTSAAIGQTGFVSFAFEHPADLPLEPFEVRVSNNEPRPDGRVGSNVVIATRWRGEFNDDPDIPKRVVWKDQHRYVAFQITAAR